MADGIEDLIVSKIDQQSGVVTLKVWPEEGDNLEDFKQTETERYVIEMVVRFFNAESLEPDQGEVLHRIKLVYDPKDPVTCRENKVSVGTIDNQVVWLGQDSVVQWPLEGDGVINRCPVPTEIYVRNDQTADWIKVLIDEEFTWDDIWSFSVL